MSFESSGVCPLEDYERRRIGYRLVRLLDSPDELRSREIGVLDQGDEVQLLQRHGAYWLVLCPDGRQGWIHRMTLADPLQAAQQQAELEPLLLAEEWQGSSDGIEYPEEASADGLLEAYMTARRDVLRNMADETGGIETPVDVMGHTAFQGATFAAPVSDFQWTQQAEAAPVAAPEAAPHAAPETAPAMETQADAVDSAAAAAAAAADAANAAAAAAAAAMAAATTAVEPEAAGSPASEPPAAGPERAGARYSARKSAGTHKAAASSRTGTKSRRPSR
jgi:hypothetical protein